MFDIDNTIKWVRAVLQAPDTVAADYRETAAPWQRSFVQLTLPLYIAAFVVASIVAVVTGGSLMYGAFSLGTLLFAVIWSLAWTFVIAFIFDLLAGSFEGKRSFDAAYAVVALAIVPSAIGTAVSSLPWLGWLISLAAGIYSLMLAYRFIPVFLEVPEAARTKHFLLSILAAFLVNLLVTFSIGAMLIPAAIYESSTSDSGSVFDSTSETGADAVTGAIFGGLERQADYMEQASQDTYQPPADGKLTERQVRVFTDVLKKTRMLQDRLSESFEQVEGEEQPSLSDVFSGVGDAMRLSTAEMEVVKTAGGNWAEHQWVRSQLEIARVQQDLNEAVAHNYALFLEYQSDIEQFE